MKTIIVGTDYSGGATNALHYAASLAQESAAKIVLFNSFQLPAKASESFMASTGFLKYLDDNKTRLGKVAFEVSRQYKIEVEPITTVSYVAEELHALADKLQADLIVLGAQENSSEYGFLGSLTTYMISNTKFPVLVVPDRTPFAGIKEIAFACDLNSLNGESRLSLLKETAIIFKAHIQVVYVKKVRDYLADSAEGRKGLNLENIFDGISHTYRDQTDEHVLDGIEKGIRESNADLLVMVPKNTGFWNMIFNRSKTCKMAKQTHVPLLALPSVERKKEAIPSKNKKGTGFHQEKPSPMI